MVETANSTGQRVQTLTWASLQAVPLTGCDLRQASVPLWASVSPNAFCFGFPGVRSLLRPHCYTLFHLCLSSWAGRRCIHSPTYTYPDPSDVTGRLREMALTKSIFFEGPSRCPAPQSHHSGPSRDMSSPCSPSTIKLGQLTHSSTA